MKSTHPCTITDRKTIVTGGGHFPVLIRLQNGELLCAVRGGFAHILGEGRLDVIRSADEGQTWSSPRTVVEVQGKDNRNPAMGQLADGTVVLAYGRYDLQQRRWEGVWAIRSRDHGRSWDEPTLVSPHSPEGGGSPYGKIVQVADGTALLSLYSSDDLRALPILHDGIERAWVARSTDGGRTWGDASLIAEGFNEVGLAVVGGRHLLAALRRSPGPEYDSLWIATSDDGGRNWAAPRQITQQGEHPGDLVLLRDGRLILTYGVRHDPDERFVGYDCEDPTVHQMGVEALVSSDGGATWPTILVLDHTAPNYDCGYPSSAELEDGRILTVYYVVTGKADYDLAGTTTRMVCWSTRTSFPDGNASGNA
ncbi:MAG: exo-alpha-sialidase [Armatimonadetes bacterium]|nr:exo-alpha-sialidase [Armatimonadota bacterium]